MVYTSKQLFLAEKLGLVLLQDMPSSADSFEHFRRVLDDEGAIVKINCWPQQDDESVNIIEQTGACEGSLSVHDVAAKIRCSFEEAKFHLRLACCSQYLTYNGVWSSSKEDPNTWKVDLRYLLALLGEGKLNPRYRERICLEDVGE